MTTEQNQTATVVTNSRYFTAGMAAFCALTTAWPSREQNFYETKWENQIGSTIPSDYFHKPEAGTDSSIVAFPYEFDRHSQSLSVELTLRERVEIALIAQELYPDRISKDDDATIFEFLDKQKVSVDVYDSGTVIVMVPNGEKVDYYELDGCDLDLITRLVKHGTV